MKTLKVLGLLMSYPEGWIAHLDECEEALLQEEVLPKKALSAVLALVDEMRAADIYALQEDYVSTFDRGRSHCLHLFEHIHGESRDRGQAMVNLAAAYEEKGLFIDAAELPDYLPLFLEYLSLCPPEEALGLLGEPIDIIATIAARLEEKQSRYAALFSALVALSRVKPDHARIQKVLTETREDDSLEALDKEWEEAAAFDGQPDQGSCNGCADSSGGLNVTISQ
ncbi:MAG: nitrate reductase molybdenum cofactor assembly chaperone [Xanthomonadales bacterium]|nr:nitrate reductase molybdenum cofactor assembly chaperone [Gammaproteobacteria bacterium]MBT8050643.1 nitrate reductase molybdenum cofactor assembly chaperone [Gammaproteobacteria bacterium]MBT8057724.1 nitrate reductase molybdenum cofactor assembly chaperone [Gammaproteobacteria bacterium]NNJ78123.1 nitrate reductase molybdenum cofactor assembly chaperone [Xanthomonadales bacterium]NNK51501.1 nitrate reductase molybdenum cofactor assembly chaperone [Xanthomonadales bacterium]